MSEQYPPKIVAAILGTMQQERYRLIGMADNLGVATEQGQQCLRLAQVLEIGKDAMKEPFMEAIG